jgi:Methyltransferase domain
MANRFRTHADVEPFPNIVCLTEGLKSLREVPDASVDFLFSNTVLEHIRLKEFLPLVLEVKRVFKPEGIASHQIDFRDHLQYALNNPRFSERIWESDFMAKSRFYTNRIPWAKMQTLLQSISRSQLSTGTLGHLPDSTKQNVFAI